MGIVEMPAITDYWSEDTRYDKVADSMPRDRYKKLRRFIHFNNNETITDDKIGKIRIIMDTVRNNCQQIENEKRYSIDEMMIPYKGKKAGSLRQYLPKKPKKWGFKFFVRAGVSGMVYDFV